MSTKAELNKAILALRGSPSFSDFIKTLTGRREAVVSCLVNELDQSKVEILRGEVRALDYILNAARDP